MQQNALQQVARALKLIFDEQKQVAVEGPGRMAPLLLQHLQPMGCRGVVVLSRTVARAEALAARGLGLVPMRSGWPLRDR